MDGYAPRRITPQWIAEKTGGRLHPGGKEVEDLGWDSRAVTPGSLFVALPGRRTHGRLYLGEARARGASLLLADLPGEATVEVEDPYQALLRLGGALRDLFPGRVVAVGGSAGKTTTKEALAQGLGFPAPPGNENTAPPLARFFLRLSPKARGAVVELGVDRIGEMEELMGLAKPHLALLTALGEEHLEGFGSLEKALEEERKLLKAPLALVGEPALPYLQDPPPAYGFREGAFRGEDLVLGLEGSRFRYRGRVVEVPYPGLGPAYGALAALAVAEVLGEDLEGVVERLRGLRLPPGRMERRVLGGVVFLHDAYNANPLSVKAGLRWLAAQPGRKWAVLGEMRELGGESERLHLEVAEEASRLGLRPLYLGPFARAQAALGGEWAESLEEALLWLKERAAPGDLVYLKASRAVGLERLLELWQEPSP